MMALHHNEEFDTSNPKEWQSYASRLVLTLHENNKKLKLAQSTHSPLPFRSKPVDLMRSCIVSDVCSTTHARGRNIVAKGMEWFEPLGIRTEDVNNIIKALSKPNIFSSVIHNAPHRMLLRLLSSYHSFLRNKRQLQQSLCIWRKG
ncbi:hypothetical protein TPS_00337 [Trichinella pseudospiralis]